MDHKKFVKYCIVNLDLNEADQSEEYFWPVPLCAMNSVFSINTKYKAVTNSLNRSCQHFHLRSCHPNITNNETFQECIKRISGQSSGLSLKYFVKPTK
jgi:hypothetical protein